MGEGSDAKIVMWMTAEGPRRLDELSREELLDVVRYLMTTIDMLRTTHAVETQAWRSVAGL
jgi:hypothetical protein